MPLPDVPRSAHGPDEMRAVLDAWSHVDLGEFVVTVTKWKFVSRDKGIEIEWPGAEASQIRDDRSSGTRRGFGTRSPPLMPWRSGSNPSGCCNGWIGVARGLASRIEETQKT
jgi:hypothetical protein